MRNNNLDTQYIEIANKILSDGKYKKTRNGNVYSTFCHEIRHNMSDGFPILTTKHMSLKNIFTELKWFMLGRTDLRFLLERKCYIWNGDAHKNYIRNVKKYLYDAYADIRTWKYFNLTDEEDDKEYNPWEFLIYKGILKTDPDEKSPYLFLGEEEFIEKIITDDDFNNAYGDLGAIYGAQWLNFNGDAKNLSELAEDCFDENKVNRGFNQIKMILDLLKHDPDSRRIRVTAWNPSVLNDIALPSCHTDFQCYTEELSEEEKSQHYKDFSSIPSRKLSLMFSCRSQDFFLGTPYNTSSYGLLTMILSKIFKYKPDMLIHRMADTHIYEDHLDAINTQINNMGYKLPILKLKGLFDSIDEYWVDGEFKWIEFIEQLEWKNDFELIGYENDGVIKAPLLT